MPVDNPALEVFAAEERRRLGIPDDVVRSIVWRVPREKARELGLNTRDPFDAVRANYTTLADLAAKRGCDWGQAARDYAGAPAVAPPRTPRRASTPTISSHWRTTRPWRESIARRLRSSTPAPSDGSNEEGRDNPI